jgi:hypothetical protein
MVAVSGLIPVARLGLRHSPAGNLLMPRHII